MPNLDLKLDVSRIQAEQRAKEEKKRKEEERQQLQSRMRYTKRSTPQSNSQVVIDDAIAKIVLKPLTSGTQTPSANRQQRPLSKQEQVSVSQHKRPIRGASSEVLGDTPSSPKPSISGPGLSIKENITQLRLLLQKFFQNTSANKKSQQQKEAALQETLKKRAAAEEEEQRKQSRRF